MRGREGFETLRRIALMLLALAVLADRAAGRSAGVRALVLSALRPAEAAASTLAAEAAPLVASECLQLNRGDEADDAARMARRLRALAIMFFWLACLAPRRRAARKPAPHGHARPRPAAGAIPAVAQRSRAPPACPSRPSSPSLPECGFR